jgi:hypothetical protein
LGEILLPQRFAVTYPVFSFSFFRLNIFCTRLPFLWAGNVEVRAKEWRTLYLLVIFL